MLKQILADLYNGKTLNLSYRLNQNSEELVDHTLRFEDGQWLVGELNCISSQSYGLGTCQCNSHPAWTEEATSRSLALGLIRDYIKKAEIDAAYRAEETAWLEQQIATLKI